HEGVFGVRATFFRKISAALPLLEKRGERFICSLRFHRKQSLSSISGTDLRLRRPSSIPSAIHSWFSIKICVSSPPAAPSSKLFGSRPKTSLGGYFTRLMAVNGTSPSFGTF